MITAKHPRQVPGCSCHNTFLGHARFHSTTAPTGLSGGTEVTLGEIMPVRVSEGGDLASSAGAQQCQSLRLFSRRSSRIEQSRVMRPSKSRADHTMTDHSCRRQLLRQPASRLSHRRTLNRLSRRFWFHKMARLAQLGSANLEVKFAAGETTDWPGDPTSPEWLFC